jgi:hypothetical protein
MSNYQTLWGMAVIATVASALTGAMLLAGGEKLGLSDVAMAWVAVVASVLGTLNGFLPPLQRLPSSKDNAGPASSPDPMPRNT